MRLFVPKRFLLLKQQWTVEDLEQPEWMVPQEHYLKFVWQHLFQL